MTVSIPAWGNPWLLIAVLAVVAFGILFATHRRDPDHRGCRRSWAACVVARERAVWRIVPPPWDHETDDWDDT